MTTILQISDTHIVRQGALVSGQLDTAAALTRLVDRLISIREQLGVIDAVVVSGDLTDDGAPESYDRFKTLLAPLDLSLLVIPGNHDAHDRMRAAFADQFAPSGALNWVTQVGELTVIGLDTLVEGAGEGTLSAPSLTFLGQALDGAKDRPVLLAMHHPPFLSGVGFMDAIGLTNRAAFCNVVAGHKTPLRVICGHIHSMMVADVAGHIAISAPSPCSTIATDRRPDAPVGFHALEDGCLIHRWNAGFQTTRIGPDAGPGPFPF